MRLIKIFAVIVAFTGIMYVELTSGDNAFNYDPNYVPEIKYSKNNQSVLMTGCQTHNPPVPAKVVYPTVSRNFITLLCALEVPPPQGVLLLQRFPKYARLNSEN